MTQAINLQPIAKLVNVGMAIEALNQVSNVIDLGAPHMAVLFGPPGYGKTTLIAEWADAHPRQRIRWMQLGTEGDVSASFMDDLAGVLELPLASEGSIAPARSGSASTRRWRRS